MHAADVAAVDRLLQLMAMQQLSFFLPATAKLTCGDMYTGVPMAVCIVALALVQRLAKPKSQILILGGPTMVFSSSVLSSFKSLQVCQ